MAGRRLQVTHRTGYRYADAVSASFNEVRMTPLTARGQQLLSHRLEIVPAAAVHTYVDYWGARVAAFDVHVPHQVLEVIAHSTVDTAGMQTDEANASWESLNESSVRNQYAEYLAPSAYVDLPGKDSRRQAVARMLAAATPRDAVEIAAAHVYERMQYQAGSTHVGTTAEESWASGSGVCQDFTHTTLSLLRGAGIPSRYVSGYLHTEEPAVGETVTGESHAWVEYWLGEWRALDPTNGRGVGGAHVVVAYGRDYADVPPLKGIYAGGQSEGLGVSIEITQLRAE